MILGSRGETCGSIKHWRREEPSVRLLGPRPIRFTRCNGSVLPDERGRERRNEKEEDGGRRRKKEERQEDERTRRRRGEDESDDDDDDDAEPSSTQLAARVPCIMPSCNAYLIQGQLYYSPRCVPHILQRKINRCATARSLELLGREAIERAARVLLARSKRGGIKLLPRLFQAMISLPAQPISGRRSPIPAAEFAAFLAENYRGASAARRSRRDPLSRIYVSRSFAAERDHFAPINLQFLRPQPIGPPSSLSHLQRGRRFRVNNVLEKTNTTSRNCFPGGSLLPVQLKGRSDPYLHLIRLYPAVLIF